MIKSTFEERFWAKVDMSGDCWIWQGTKPNGYGQIRNGKKVLAAHRVAWELAHGPIPEGMQIDHICHTAVCVRASHLRLASKRENIEYRRGPQRNNSSTGVRNVQRRGDHYRVRIQSDGRLVHFGTFDTLEEAKEVAARERAKLFSFPDFETD